ncbi:hypothetical protein DEU56DRAFT_765516 [Suillus clintonianus]|uniref:uncharacterized protein n=1 Tax=Suillus clintonianus TaxID=1904413 RepID=UPI001B86AEDA|nr:uncharacterized protein DEU56DRAFT_765516 [Suillus clintonianus]KAG2156092.1 hypothetical protein DEU56DRAFT_765516 [Suillus clintonianus]
MGFLDAFTSSQSEQFYDSDAPHKASLSHELLGGAVAFEAAKAYEDHCAKNGKPDNHALAKELFAGFAGAALDRVVETKGADAWSDHQRKKAHEHAREQINETFTETVYEENY